MCYKCKRSDFMLIFVDSVDSLNSPVYFAPPCTLVRPCNYNYLPDFSLYLMLIIRVYVVSVCINVMALYGYLAPLVSGSFAHAKSC